MLESLNLETQLRSLSYSTLSCHTIMASDGIALDAVKEGVSSGRQQMSRPGHDFGGASYLAKSLLSIRLSANISAENHMI